MTSDIGASKTFSLRRSLNLGGRVVAKTLRIAGLNAAREASMNLRIAELDAAALNPENRSDLLRITDELRAQAFYYLRVKNLKLRVVGAILGRSRKSLQDMVKPSEMTEHALALVEQMKGEDRENASR